MAKQENQSESQQKSPGGPNGDDADAFTSYHQERFSSTTGSDQEIAGRAGMGRMASVWFGILIGGIALVVIVVMTVMLTQ